MAAILDLIITSEAKTRIEDFIVTLDLPECMAGLLQSTDGRWYIGGYDKDRVAELKRMYEEKGIGLIYKVDGLEILIPQHHLIAELKGKTLHHNENEYILSERKK